MNVVRSLCSVAAALNLGFSLGTANPASAETMYVFGDSSADVGSQGPDRRPTNKGDMWSEALAKRIGVASTRARGLSYDAAGNLVGIAPAGGTNYAINGSTAVKYPEVFSLSEQVDFFLADRKSFHPDDLSFVWITRNDITTAFFDGLDYDPNAYAAAYVDAIGRMQRAGARNIVAFGAETKLLPVALLQDAGIPDALIDQLEDASRASDAALWPRLTAKNVYILDVDRLAEDVRLNLARYGFAYTIDSYQGRGDASGRPSQDYDNDGNVFTNDGHYTTAMQAVVADFTLAQTRARDQFRSNLLQSALTFRDTFAAASAIAPGDVTPGRPDWAFSASASVSAARTQRDGLTDVAQELDGASGRLTAAWNVDADWLLGGQIDWGLRSGEFADRAGRTEQNLAQASAFALRRMDDGWYVQVAASVGGVSYTKIERTTSLGAVAYASAEGETAARSRAAKLAVGRLIDFGDWRASAEVSLTSEATTIDAYRETPGLLALAYGDSDLSATILGGGFRIERTPRPNTLGPYMSASFTHDLNDKDVTVRVGPTSSTIVDYVTKRPFWNQATLELGVEYRPADGVSITGGVRSTASFGDSAAWTDTSLQIGLRAEF